MAAAKPAGDGHNSNAEVEAVARQLEELSVQPLDTPSPPAPPLQKPVPHPVSTEGRRFVYFDLETTGLGRHSHITQIAAFSGEDELFSSFVRPKIPISEHAQQITGITCTSKQMCHHGKPVSCNSITRALKDLIHFLGNEPVVILGHNVKRFDCPILLNALQACNLVEPFRQGVHGFVDTLPLFRDVNKALKSYKLINLYGHYISQDFPAHDARTDARALQEIVNVANLDHATFARHSFTFDDIVEDQRYNAAKRRLVSGWKPLVSKYLAEKAAENGLSWETVRQKFEKEGEEGVREMLKSKLTKNEEVIKGICKHLHGSSGN